MMEARADVDTESSGQRLRAVALSMSTQPANRHTKLHVQSMLPSDLSRPSGHLLPRRRQEINGRDDLAIWVRVESNLTDDEKTRSASANPNLPALRLSILPHRFCFIVGRWALRVVWPVPHLLDHAFISMFLFQEELWSEVGLLSTRFFFVRNKWKGIVGVGSWGTPSQSNILSRNCFLKKILFLYY